MDERDEKLRLVHENLDTAYVNLAALLRYLQERAFEGRLHLELSEYEADIFLSAGGETHVRETDQRTGRQAEGEDALQRVLVRASEPGGLVSVYQKIFEEQATAVAAPLASDSVDAGAVSPESLNEEREWQELVQLSGELIATIERAALSAGADFQSLFRAVRLSMADDYPFLDPSAGRFEYGNGAVELHAEPSASIYVSSLCEALHRIVDKIATGPRRVSLRERVALELAVLARRRQAQLTKYRFTQQLDRIAGTRVL